MPYLLPKEIGELNHLQKFQWTFGSSPPHYVIYPQNGFDNLDTICSPLLARPTPRRSRRITPNRFKCTFPPNVTCAELDLKTLRVRNTKRRQEYYAEYDKMLSKLKEVVLVSEPFQIISRMQRAVYN